MVNISIVLGNARGIICAHNSDVFSENEGHIQITKDWAVSIAMHELCQMKGTNSTMDHE